MKITDTVVDPGGLMRCCLSTLGELPEGDYENGAVLDCKFEAPGNANLILLDGCWKWNRKLGGSRKDIP